MVVPRILPKETTMTNFLRSTFILAALVATPVIAQSAPATNKVIVRTADLDLTTASGQRLLERRLTAAIDDACGAASRVDLAGSNDVRRCREEVRGRITADRSRLIATASRPTSIVLAAR